MEWRPELLDVVEGSEGTAVRRGTPRARSLKWVKTTRGMEAGKVTAIEPRGVVVVVVVVVIGGWWVVVGGGWWWWTRAVAVKF